MIARPSAPGLAWLSWGSPLVGAALAILLGGAVGAAVVLGSPIAALATAAGLVGAVVVAWSVRAGMLALVAVASLLPYGVIPFRVGVQLTFVDALLILIFGGWIVHYVLREGRIELTPVGRLLAAYVAVALAALLVGMAYAPLSGPVLRSFLKYVAAILVFVPVVNVVRERGQVRMLVRALIVGGALAASIGLLVHAQPMERIVDLLSSLSVVGYPSGREVLRYLPGPNNTYSDVLRATGTQIDPNVFGGLLMLAGALTLAQVFAPRPVLPRWLLLPMLLLMAGAMVLSQSRSSWLSLAAAGAYLATVRDRRLWLLGLAGGAGLMVLPVGRNMLDRLASGFAARDRAAALRLDEYRQAIQIIRDYPVLGVGFGGAPELGTFVGVSSIYLLVGEHTGLVGLGLLLLTLATLAVVSTRALIRARDPNDRALVATLQAPLVAALVAGLFDHYFMNPQFPHMVALLWLYAGLLVATSRLVSADVQPSGRGAYSFERRGA